MRFEGGYAGQGIELGWGQGVRGRHIRYSSHMCRCQSLCSGESKVASHVDYMEDKVKFSHPKQAGGGSGC